MRIKIRAAAAISILVISVLILNNLGLFDNFFSSAPSTAGENATLKNEDPVEAKEPEMRYGLPVDSFELHEDIVKNGESFSNILLAFGVNYQTIHDIASKYKDIFDVRKLRSGKPYTLFCENQDTNRVARYMVYQPSPVDYYVFDFSDSVNVYKGAKDVSVKKRVISGKIESSLYETIVGKGGSPALVMELSTIYAWTIDFFRIKKGDYFKVIYEEKFIDDTISVGVGRLIAADFNHGDRSFYSFWYQNPAGNYSEYFDEEGNTLRKAFLKAPLNFYRLSSRYSPKRFHPVLKRYKAHLGTDYAAPKGTPIMATADGEVIAASYTGGNGNYVKIRHNSTYTTQYLHMSGFAKGIRTGKVVKQGEVIGYVGSTGLATGPHVCYRFWKNGVQVDPYQQDLPDAEPIKDEYRGEYEPYMMKLKQQLDAIKIPGEEKGHKLQFASAGTFPVRS